MLHQVSQRRGRAVRQDHIPDLALGDLDQGGAVAIRVEVAFIDDADIMVAPQRGDVRPLGQVEQVAGHAEQLRPQDAGQVGGLGQNHAIAFADVEGRVANPPRRKGLSLRWRPARFPRAGLRAVRPGRAPGLSARAGRAGGIHLAGNPAARVCKTTDPGSLGAGWMMKGLKGTGGIPGALRFEPAAQRREDQLFGIDRQRFIGAQIGLVFDIAVEGGGVDHDLVPVAGGHGVQHAPVGIRLLEEGRVGGEELVGVEVRRPDGAQRRGLFARELDHCLGVGVVGQAGVPQFGHPGMRAQPAGVQPGDRVVGRKVQAVGQFDGCVQPPGFGDTRGVLALGQGGFRGNVRQRGHVGSEPIPIQQAFGGVGDVRIQRSRDTKHQVGWAADPRLSGVWRWNNRRGIGVVRQAGLIRWGIGR